MVSAEKNVDEWAKWKYRRGLKWWGDNFEKRGGETVVPASGASLKGMVRGERESERERERE